MRVSDVTSCGSRRQATYKRGVSSWKGADCRSRFTSKSLELMSRSCVDQIRLEFEVVWSRQCHIFVWDTELVWRWYVCKSRCDSISR
jgi:hypothetical protein